MIIFPVLQIFFTPTYLGYVFLLAYAFFIVFSFFRR